MSDAENYLDRFIGPSETVIRAIEIIAAYLLVGLFGIGVLDLLISIFGLVRTGVIFDAEAGIDAILTVIDKHCYCSSSSNCTRPSSPTRARRVSPASSSSRGSSPSPGR